MLHRGYERVSISLSPLIREMHSHKRFSSGFFGALSQILRQFHLSGINRGSGCVASPIYKGYVPKYGLSQKVLDLIKRTSFFCKKNLIPFNFRCGVPVLIPTLTFVNLE